MNALASLSLLLLTLGVVACDRPAAAVPASEPLALVTHGSSLLERMPDAPYVVRYAGRRRVQASYEFNHQPQVLDYTERVASDGQGRFSVELESLTSPVLSPTMQSVMALLHEVRSGFLYRVRDFRVRELPLFLASHTMEELGASTVANMPCERFAVQSILPSPVRYELDVEPHTALVMRAREIESTTGSTLSSVEFLDIDLSPDLSSVSSWHADLPKTELDLTQDTTPQIGFTVLAPRYVPTGYRRTAAEILAESDQLNARRWARLTFSDGADQIFYLHSPLVHAGGGSSVGSAPLKHTLKILSIGRWRVLQARARDEVILVVGKVAEARLREMIESALP